MSHDERVLYAAKRPIQCRKKKIHQDSLTDMAIHRQKSDVNAVHLIKNLNYINFSYHVSSLFKRSFSNIENDDYDYNDT